MGKPVPDRKERLGGRKEKAAKEGGRKMLGSKEKGFLLHDGGVEGGQGGVALGRSCTLPGFSLGGPPGGARWLWYSGRKGQEGREVGGI